MHTGEVDIPAGKSTLTLKALSPYIDPQSIQLKAKGDFSILSVNHQLNYLAQETTDKEAGKLRQQVRNLDSVLALKRKSVDVLSAQKQLLEQNRSIKGQGDLSIEKLKAALTFYEQELNRIYQ